MESLDHYAQSAVGLADFKNNLERYPEQFRKDTLELIELFDKYKTIHKPESARSISLEINNLLHAPDTDYQLLNIVKREEQMISICLWLYKKSLIANAKMISEMRARVPTLPPSLEGHLALLEKVTKQIDEVAQEFGLSLQSLS